MTLSGQKLCKEKIKCHFLDKNYKKSQLNFFSGQNLAKNGQIILSIDVEDK